jgi:protein SCO1/2
MKKSVPIFVVGIIVLNLFSCGDDFPIIEDLSKPSYILINQDSLNFRFPDDLKSKLVVMGFIFTNCPDICPLTTNNMRLIQERLKGEQVQDVEFVSLSFDPETDKPSVLKKFGEIRDLDLSNWVFLTGEKDDIKSIIKNAGVFAVPGDSIKFDNGEKIYLYVHSDRISLLDKSGRIRKNYSGSKANVEQIVKDIITLSD